MSLLSSAPPGFCSTEVTEAPNVSSVPCFYPDDYQKTGQLFQDSSEIVTRRSNSRSGYRVFARVVEGRTALTSRMPSREEVCGYFGRFGMILDCYLPDSATNVAYICFEEQFALESCLAMVEHRTDSGILMTVSRASPRPDYSVNTDRIFTKNVPAGVTRLDLKNYFGQFGEVIDVYIPKDKLTGAQKRFAFVTFREVRSARTALAHDLHYFQDGSCMQVMPAEARPMLKWTNRYDNTYATHTPSADESFNILSPDSVARSVAEALGGFNAPKLDDMDSWISKLTDSFSDSRTAPTDNTLFFGAADHLSIWRDQ